MPIPTKKKPVKPTAKPLTAPTPAAGKPVAGKQLPRKPAVPAPPVNKQVVPTPPRKPAVQPQKAPEPQVLDRKDFKNAAAFAKVFDGRGLDMHNPVPLREFLTVFPRIYGNGRDIPSDLWVEDHGIVYCYVDMGNNRAMKVKPKIDVPAKPKEVAEEQEESENVKQRHGRKASPRRS